ncbi:MAG: hypothetical protein JNL58_23055 [Planctomyces sp.]|nr:hypothetical protein [Planctomyces sp.]
MPNLYEGSLILQPQTVLQLAYGHHEFGSESVLTVAQTQVFNANVTFCGQTTIEELNAVNFSSVRLTATNPQISVVNMSNSSLDVSPVQADSVAVFGTLNLPGGTTLSGQSTVQINDVFNWDGGNIGTLDSETTLSFSGDILCNGGTVRNATITNSGDLTWGAGQVSFFGNESQFINALGSTFTITFDGVFGSADGHCIEFRNDGLVRKTANTGITYFYLRLYNRGVVQIDQGQIYLGCGYVSNNPDNPPGDGISYPPDHPPEYRNDDPIVVVPDPVGDPDPIVYPGSFTQSISGSLIELIAGHTPPGQYGIPGADYGQLVVLGDVSLAGTLEVQLINGFVPSIGQEFLILDNRGTNPIDGEFFGLTEGDLIWDGIYGFEISYFGGNGNDVVLTMSQFANTPPVAVAGGPYSVLVGGTIQLSGIQSTDNEQASESLIFEWDLDGDGLFGETGSNALRGDENLVAPVFSATGLPANTEYQVSLRVIDEYGESDIDHVLVSILNSAPVVTLSGPSTVTEGSTARYTFVTVDSTDTFSITSISGGIAGTVSNLQFDSSSGIGSFDVTFGDGPSDSTVSIRIADSYGAESSISEVIVSILNAAPTIQSLTSSNSDITLASVDGNVSIAGTFFDPARELDTHTVTVDWGDGTTSTVTTNQLLDSFLGTHQYATGGVFQISVIVTDSDGATSSVAMVQAVVRGINVVGGTLFIIGTSGEDRIRLRTRDGGAILTVDAKLNWNQDDGDDDRDDDCWENHDNGGRVRIRTSFPMSSIDRVVAILGDGDDRYDGSSESSSHPVAISQTVLGGSGNDSLSGGAGRDFILGQAGNDDIRGGDGHDVLIGGDGNDTMRGGRGDDVLIGGIVMNDESSMLVLNAIDTAMAEWATGDVEGTLMAFGVIVDDCDKDSLFGENGDDDLFGGSGDKLRD